MDQYQSKNLPWLLILSLGALALVRPIMSMTGLPEAMGQPIASITITILISLVWFIVVVRARVHQPLLTLVLTGISYGVFAIILSAVLSPILIGHLQGPVTNPFAIVSVLITNAFWGWIVGLAASTTMRACQQSD